MSDWYTIAGVGDYDGRYELDYDAQPLTTREWGWIKRFAGYLPATLTRDAMGDPELHTVLAAIAVRRAGTVDTAEMPGLLDRLFDAPTASAITVESDPDEDDAGPPPRSSDSRPSSNGDGSPTGSETSAVPQSPTGVLPSDTSESAQLTSVS